jgi:hypothetical protein
VSDYPVGAAIAGAVFYAPSVLQGRRPQARLCAKLEKYAASAIVALSPRCCSRRSDFSPVR